MSHSELIHVKKRENLYFQNKTYRNKTISTLKKIGLDYVSFLNESSILHPNVSDQEENSYIAKLIQQMYSPFSPNYQGFFFLNIATALDNESSIEQALKEHVGKKIEFRQIFAFKSNHSLPLQHARLKKKNNSGLEVASLPEVVEACSLGFLPENIIFANPTLNEREFICAYHLGVTAFCFDHINKLKNIKNICQTYGLDTTPLRLIIRLAAPFGGANVSMSRFGIDVLKNLTLIRSIFEFAQNTSIHIAGVSFHIGIGATFYATYDNIFRAISEVFNVSYEITGQYPDIVNIGGGFDMSESGLKYLGTLRIDEQINRLGLGLRQLRAQFQHPFAIWSEIGQGCVGNAGSAFIRVEYQEFREKPGCLTPIAVPLPPGSVLWTEKFTLNKNKGW